METIRIGTTYRRNNDRNERQFFYDTDEKEQQEKQANGKHHLIQNDLEYADDTQLFMEKDTHGQICERIGNYDIATESRHLKIQWGKVELLRPERRKLKKSLPPPFDLIKHNCTGTIIGKK